VRRPRYLLDANVLVDAQVRDLFCRFAEAELIDVRWSATILDEVRRTLTGRLGLDARKVERLLDLLDRAFPDASVAGFDQLVDGLQLPDPDDRHVLAAAIHAECDVLVTDNRSDFPDDACGPHDLDVLSSDLAIVRLVKDFTDEVKDIVTAQVTALRHPPQSIEEFVHRLADRAAIGAMVLGAALGLETYVSLLHEFIDADSEASPHQAVLQLVEATAHGDGARLLMMVDPALAKRLTSADVPTPDQLCDALATVLADRLDDDGWGYVTARGIQTLDHEVVKCFRGGPGARLIDYDVDPADGLETVDFHLQLSGAGWVLVDLIAT
jgi:predicted nucleic acid-binding protein